MADDVVLGVDSGTQSTKVVLLDVETNAIVANGSAPHADGTVQHPMIWWRALRDALKTIPLNRFNVVGMSISAQQHGCVMLAAGGKVLRPAPLWNDLSAAADAERLNELADFATETGSRLVSSFTIAKLAHLARTEPDAMTEVATAALPHDWLNFQLTGLLRTDRGDASGSGWWSPRTGKVRRDLLALAIGDDNARRIQLPEVLGPNDAAGNLTPEAAAFLGLRSGLPVAAGSGDNMAAALGIGAEIGELTVSLGTSGVVSCMADSPVADRIGRVNGFADATGKFLPLTCMLNCTRVFDSMAALFGIERDEGLSRASRIEPGANGLTLTPYFGGERCPNLPDARGSIVGISYDNLSSAELLRAAIDGVAAGIAHCVDILSSFVPTGPDIVITGGGAAHPAWRRAVADATGRTVIVRAGGEHAARGAAIQALALIRNESVGQLASRLRPASVEMIEPRREFRTRFQSIPST